MKRQRKYFIDLAHMHPVCPLSLSHARVFVLADVWARWQRIKGKKVKFPILMHYSGSTAFRISSAVKKYLKRVLLTDGEEKIISLLESFYKVPEESIHEFAKPRRILDYFSEQIISDLKVIDISCDYEHYFNTKNPLYEDFVRSIFLMYEKKSFLKRINGDETLDYENTRWRTKTLSQTNKTNFIKDKNKKDILNSVEDLDNNWRFERDAKSYIGAEYKSKLIDSMFDCEFLSMFSVLCPILNIESLGNSMSDVFTILLKKLFNSRFHSRKISNNILERLVEQLNNWLPVDIFFVEDHLKPWIAKKIYSETVLLPEKLRTKSYFVLGSVTLNKKPMSASKGHGMLLPDLINKYGAIGARLSLLACGGHPSKYVEWEKGLPIRMKKSVHNLINFLKIVSAQKARAKESEIDRRIVSFIKNCRENNDAMFNKYNFKELLINFIDIFPKKISALVINSPKIISEKTKKEIFEYSIDRLSIFCPSVISEVEKIYETN